jgi:hypothetical protein
VGERLRQVTTGHLGSVTRRSGRPARHIVGVLLLAFTMSQALVVAHGHTHVPTQTGVPCGVCRLGSQPAHLLEAAPELLEPGTVSVQLVAVPCALYVRRVYGTRIARAPPLSSLTSDAG